MILSRSWAPDPALRRASIRAALFGSFESAMAMAMLVLMPVLMLALVLVLVLPRGSGISGF